jgi:putative DNA primase/helicase
VSTAGGDEKLVTVTFFPDVRAAAAAEQTLPLEQLAAKIQLATAPSKAELSLLKMGRFGKSASAKGSLRHDDNLLACTGVEADYDAERIPFAEACERLRKAGGVGVLAIVYTTASHTPERPRWRVLAPFSQELAPAGRAHMVGRLNGLFGGGLGVESWTLSQAFFYGGVIPRSGETDAPPSSDPYYQVEIVEGVPIDLADDLDETWIGKPNTKADGSGQFTNGPVDEAALEQAITDGEAYHVSVVRLSGLWAAQGVPIDQAEARLRHLFAKVAPGERDARWQDRIDDVRRTVGDIYRKEQEKLAQAGPDPDPSPEHPADSDASEGLVDDDAEITRLATLKLLEYERERRAAAKRLGCSVATLDRLVKITRGSDAAGQGRPLDLTEPEPWPSQVNGSALLDELARTTRRYLVIEPQVADGVGLWVLAVHAFDLWETFPRLFIAAPERQCGKSTLLDVLSRLAPRPLAASNITAAALFRTIEAAKPTLLLDEADTYARDNEDLRSVLDAGHNRSGAVIRTVGDNHEPRQFSVWAPVALAAIGRLPGTIEDRSIIIRLRRRRPDEQIESLRLDRAGRLVKIARMAARWAADHAISLSAADPVMPPALYNRVADNWRPLLAVADAAGGEWPGRARQAAIKLTSDGADDESSVRVALLSDIRDAFAARNADRLSSEDLVAYLVELDERPWPEFKGGKPITKTQVARLLKPFGISSGTVRFESGRTAKGYHRARLEDAFARYLPPPE